jgi:hypothetical protein
MKTLWWALALAPLVVGCSSDASTICSKLDECHDIPAGISVDSCEDRFNRLGSDDSRQGCANCIDEHGCGAIETGACNGACADFVAWVD